MGLLQLVILIIIVLLTSVFLIGTRELSAAEIKLLAEKRRSKFIESYFVFSELETESDSTFKIKMREKGKLYPFDSALYSFPDIAADLLRFRKDEWVIIGFVKEEKVILLWANKGPNTLRSIRILSPTEILNIMSQNGTTSVLIFHNHSRSKYKGIEITYPTEQNIKAAESYGAYLAKRGINLLEFVCHDGVYYEYYNSISDKFYSVEHLSKLIKREININRLNNMKLRLERIFSPKKHKIR